MPATCPLCTRPFSAQRQPKLLNCSCPSVCGVCIVSHLINEARDGVVCQQCNRETIFPDPNEGVSSLLTNFHHMLPSASVTASGSASPVRRAAGSSSSSPLSCTGPGCESSALGTCDGCYDSALCDYCYTQHLQALPSSVRSHHKLQMEALPSEEDAKNSSSSKRDETMCQRHGLPRTQLWCNDDSVSVCPTCAQCDHRNCDVVELTGAVAKRLRPTLQQREERLRQLYSTALVGAHTVVGQIGSLGSNTSEQVSSLLSKAADMVNETMCAVMEVQRSSIARQAQLRGSLQSLAKEAGLFADEANGIHRLLSSAEHPDPFKVAQYAPSGQDQVHTVVPDGHMMEAVRLNYEVTLDQRRYREQHFPLRRDSDDDPALEKSHEASICIRAGSSQGEADNQFNFVGGGGMAVLPDGNAVVVADTRNSRLQFVDAKAGSFLGCVSLLDQSHGAAAAAAAAPARPTCVCTLRNGLLLALDMERRVGHFIDPEKRQQVVPKKKGEWKFPSSWNKPVALSLLPCGGVAVLDHGRSLISVLDNELEMVVREFDGVQATVFQKAAEFVTEEKYVREKGRAMRKKVMQDRLARGEVVEESPLEEESPEKQQQQPKQHGSAGNSPNSKDSFSPSVVDNNNQPQKFRVFRSTGTWADEDFIHRISEPVGMSEAFVLKQAHIPVFHFFPSGWTQSDTTHIYPPAPKAADIPAESRCLIAVCSASAVQLLDPYTGAHVRFVGGDASQQRCYSKPLGAAASRDGERLVVVDGATNSLFVARTRDGTVLQKLHVAPPRPMLSSRSSAMTESRLTTATGAPAPPSYPQHAACLCTGQVVIADQVAHTIDFLSAFL